MGVIVIYVSRRLCHRFEQLGIHTWGSIILRYIKSSYQNDPIRSLLEFCLVLLPYHIFEFKEKENKSELVRFSRKEIDELCDEWEPAPLVNEGYRVGKLGIEISARDHRSKWCSCEIK